MRDSKGTEVVFDVVENNSLPGPKGLLAPIGDSSAQPEFFPLFYLHEFGLVRKENTRIRIAIGGKELSPKTLPFIMSGPGSYLTRYAPRVVISMWNQRREGSLARLSLVRNANSVADGNLTYELVWTDGHPEIRAVIARNSDHSLRFAFAPPIPDISSIENNVDVQGRFAIDVNQVEGVISGEYRVIRSGDAVHMELHPLNNWQPPVIRGGPWVATYVWSACFTRSPNGEHQMRAQWKRIKK